MKDKTEGFGFQNYQDKLKELEAKQAAISIEIAELAKSMKVEPASAFPQCGDKYWTIYNGQIQTFYFNEYKADNELIAVGNFFEFKEQAEAELETRKVIAELKKCKGIKKFVLDEVNYGVACSICGSIWVDWWLATLSGTFNIYFESKEATESAIEQVGKDRIIKAIKWLACGEY